MSPFPAYHRNASAVIRLSSARGAASQGIYTAN
jgi:hypothetical protein